jgi:tellurite resistance protein TerC
MILAAEEGSNAALRAFEHPPWLWPAFLAFVVVLLLLDLFVFHREAHDIGMREAGISSAAWIGLGVAFTGVVWLVHGGDAASQYITGYVIEKSLSVDNVFVWAVIFGYFSVPNKYQHRVLFWGIFGALVLRAIFIFAGVALLERLDWLLFVFGGFLLFTAWRVAFAHDDEIHPESNPVLKLVRRVVPVSPNHDGQKLFTVENGRRIATPLFVVLVLVEATDVVFAVDSVPAILAVSRDTFIVFSSNAMAILGLRALYFLLAGAKDRLVYLNQGLGIILAYVGVKMIVSRWYHIDSWLSLGVIAVILTVTVWLSLRATAGQADDHGNPDETREPAREDRI